VRDPFDNGSHNYWIPFADFLAGVLAIFLVVAILLTFHLTEAKKSRDADITSPGSIIVEIVWKEDVDVDLWIKSPDDVPVGYSRKQGKYIDLLRDDLGRQYERIGDHHEENAYARATPPGEWIINLHMFSNRADAPYPIHVDVVTTIAQKGGDGKDASKKDIKTSVDLVTSGQEITVMRFRLDSDANLVVDSVNNNEQTPLRAGQTGTP
jgi:hypothetical protein